MARNMWPLEQTNGLSVTIRIKSYPQRDSENDREEGVTADINKCNECAGDKEKQSKHDLGNDDNDSGDEKLRWALLWTWQKVNVTQEMMGMTVEMKSYNGSDSGHDGDESVTARISKCAECDISDKILPKT